MATESTLEIQAAPGRTPSTLLSTQSATSRHTTGALAYAFTPGEACEILEIRFHLGAAGGAGDFTVALNSGINTAFDVVLVTVDMTSAANVWSTDRIIMAADDVLDCAYANASNETYGLEIIWRPLA